MKFIKYLAKSSKPTFIKIKINKRNIKIIQLIKKNRTNINSFANKYLKEK